MEGFVGCASINVSPKKNSKKLNYAMNAKLDPAVRLEAGAASVSWMARENLNNICISVDRSCIIKLHTNSVQHSPKFTTRHIVLSP